MADICLRQLQCVEHLVKVIHKSSFSTIKRVMSFLIQKGLVRGDSAREFRVEFPVEL